MKRALLVIIILFCSAALFAQDEKKIMWDPVDGAYGYIVEMKNEGGKSVVKKRTLENYVFVDLTPGEYKIRITTLNVFNKEESSSEWIDYKIIRASKPVFESISQSVFNTSTKDNYFMILGKNISYDAEVSFRRPEGVIKAVVKKVNFEKELVAYVDIPDLAEAGLYTLVISNPGGTEEIPDAVQILDQYSVAIESIYPPFGFRKSKKAYMIYGENFTPEVKFYLSTGKKGDIKLDTEYISSRKIKATINLGDAKIRSYDLKARNKVGKTYLFKDYFSVKENTDGLLSMKGLYIGVSVPVVTILSSPWTGQFNNTFYGFDVNLFYSFMNLDAFVDHSILRNFGVEVVAGGTSFKGKANEYNIDKSLEIIHGGGGINYTYPFTESTHLIFHATGGMTSSRLSYSSKDTSGEMKSSDMYAAFGASLRYTFEFRVFCEAGAEYQNVFSKEPMKNYRFYTRLGLRL